MNVRYCDCCGEMITGATYSVLIFDKDNVDWRGVILGETIDRELIKMTKRDYCSKCKSEVERLVNKAPSVRVNVNVGGVL